MTIVPTAIQDLVLRQEFDGFPLHLPQQRNHAIDTTDYLIVQKSKTELVLPTTQSHPCATHHRYLDFSLFHVVGDAARCQAILLALTVRPPNQLTIPGMHSEKSDFLDAVNWHFCGGLFVGPTAEVASFSELHQQTVRERYPVLSWKVNFWAWMEIHREFNAQWFLADHNDSMIDYL